MPRKGGRRPGRVGRIGAWVLVALAGYSVGCFVFWAGAQWSEAIIQALAAIGGLWYWAYRSRPRVTLRLMKGVDMYLELTNVGNRVAKQVRLSSHSSVRFLPYYQTLSLSMSSGSIGTT